MKKLLIYCFILLFLASYSYESIGYILKAFNNSAISYFEDFDGKTPASEENEKKQDKFKSIDDHFLKNCQLLASLKPAGSSINNKDFFASDGYSQVIYSPPDSV